MKRGPQFLRGVLWQWLFAAVLASTTLGGTALGQVGGANVGGVVTDESGGRLPGATVTITNRANGRVLVLVTGTEGNYRAVALQPATYEIAVELPGFGSATREVTLNVGADITLDFKLTVASLQETVTVAGETPLVEVSKSQPKSVVAAEQIATMPVLSRSILELAQLLPGSAPDNSRARAWAVTKFGGVADQRNGFTLIVDGGSIDDSIWGNTLMNLTQEAVQEFAVHRNQFDAQFGEALSSVVSVATKSGTNLLHGSALFFSRDRRFNSKNAFAREKPPFDQQRVGGTLGGPIKTNQTHFFGAYEFNNIDTVKVLALPPSNPFAAQHNGVFPAGSSDHMATGRVDHRFRDNHSLFVRYAYDNQYILRDKDGSTESNQIDQANRTHSVVAEDSWILSQNLVNTFRVHYLKQHLGLIPHSDEPQITRPSVTTGASSNAPQFFPRDYVTLAETLYVNTPRHAIKIGGDLRFQIEHHESFFVQRGAFVFTTDAPFNQNDPATWPISFRIQQPNVWLYKSKPWVAYVQDDWRLHDRVRLNLGLRYDYDPNMRQNDFYYGLLDDPAYAGIENFISRDRGANWTNFQPRVGATWDTSGEGKLVLRGGFGRYVTRNRGWLDLTSQDQSRSATVFITDPERLRFFPSIPAILGGQSLEQFVASGGARLLSLIDDDYVLPYSLNTTAGLGWEITPRTSLTVDYVHAYATKQLGTTDRNLPASGRISATNPRPVARFAQVQVLENFTDSWYDALETQLRLRVHGTDSLQASYAFSRSYRDGVSFYSTMRGTQRTPDERGYNNTDQRHNLTLAGSFSLPWEVQLSGIAKFVSGSPFSVQTGFDIDGDGSTTGDRPPGLPTTVGREKVAESVRLINEVRASRGLSPVSEDLLRLDPFVSVDVRLTKALRLANQHRLDLFLEGFNVTNYVNYQPFTVNANINSTSFLVRNTARDARQIQWGVRYVF